MKDLDKADAMNINTVGASEDERIDLHRCMRDPFYFCRYLLGITLDKNQSSILHDVHKKKVVRAGRRFGKTTVAAAYAIWMSFKTPKFKTLVVSPAWAMSENFSEMMEDLIDGTPLQDSIVKNDKFLKCFSNGSKVYLRTVAKGSKGKQVRGKGVNLLIVEEGGLIEDEVAKDFRPTVLDKGIMEFWIGTPWGRNYFYKICTSDRFKEYHFKTSDSPRIDLEELEAEKELFTEAEVKQEFEAEFIHDQLNPISREHRDAAFDGNEELLYRGERGKSYVAGLDFGKKIDETVLIIGEWIDDLFRLVAIKSWSGIDYTKILREIKDVWAKKFNITKLVCDEASVGMHPTEVLKDTLNHTRVEGASIQKEGRWSVTNCMSNLVLQFERGNVLIPIHERTLRLRRQLDSLELRSSSSPGKKLVKGHLGDHVSALIFAMETKRKKQVIRAAVGNKIKGVIGSVSNIHPNRRSSAY